MWIYKETIEPLIPNNEWKKLRLNICTKIAYRCGANLYVKPIRHAWYTKEYGWSYRTEIRGKSSPNIIRAKDIIWAECMLKVLV